MAAPDVELADAIVADLNHVDRNWDMTFTAVRTWTPLWIGKTELATALGCLVNPWPVVEVEPEDRHNVRYQLSVDIGFAKRLSDKTRTEIDDLREQVHTITKRYAKTDYTVAGVGTFVALRRLDEYFTFDPSRLTRDPATGKYTGDFLSYFRVPFLLKETY